MAVQPRPASDRSHGHRPPPVALTTTFASVFWNPAPLPYDAFCKYNVVPSETHGPVSRVSEGPPDAHIEPSGALTRTSTIWTPTALHRTFATPTRVRSHTGTGSG